MSYRWVDHTAEVELRVEAPSPTRVFLSTMSALAELFGPATGDAQSHDLALEARDRASLLAAWLEELVYLAETEQFVPQEAEIVETNTRLRGTVRGRTGDPPPLVKAVTYHGLTFEEVDGRWTARVVLDV